MMLLQVKWKICQSVSAVHYPIRHENMNLKEPSFFQQKMRNPQSMCVRLSSHRGHLVLKKVRTTIKKLLWNQKPARKVYSLISIGSGQGNLTSTDFGILVAVWPYFNDATLTCALDSMKAILLRPEENQRSWQDWHLNPFLIFITLTEFQLKAPRWRRWALWITLIFSQLIHTKGDRTWQRTSEDMYLWRLCMNKPRWMNWTHYTLYLEYNPQW